MSKGFRRNVVRSLFLSLWAMVTLILLAMVVLLVNEILNSGRDPLGAFAIPEENTPSPERAATDRSTATGTQQAQLYFGAADGLQLAAESRPILVTGSTVENCRTALNALIAGPRAGGVSIIPPTATVKALYLLPHGELVVNFSRELQEEYVRTSSASMESLFVQGVAHTLAQSVLQNPQDPKVRKIRILVEDEVPTDAFPAHIDLSGPVIPDAQWLPARG